MIDINYLSENIDEVIKRLTTRNADFLYLKKVKQLNMERKEIITKLEQKQAEHNKQSKLIASLIQKEKTNEIEVLKEDLGSNKLLIETLKQQLLVVASEIKDLLLKTPNIPEITVPIGISEADNVEVKKWNENKALKSTHPHWDIAKDLDIIDFIRATKITGSRFVIYKNAGARLVRALINLMLDVHYQSGYEEIIPPTIVNANSLITTGNLPKFKEDLFQLQEKDYYLIPTAEVPITNLYQDEIIDGHKLPLKYCAYTTCYRSEAGAAGKDTRGIIRLHQFHKVELVKITKPEQSYDELEKLTNDACKILELLELPYRVIELCTGELGFSAAKTYDIEVWMPSQNKYREISSCSNCEDFQARRGKIRYKAKSQDNAKLVHTLNGSGLAVDRLVAAILENNYQSDGKTVVIPKILQKYLGGLEKITV
ncbi:MULTISPECIES: serine--tRNA ligase [unclassified Spiroplasma]|uniref:serine--tRNA ligase n=1 Tax=unclassified Spiroplasma TaxID=2637901 RepID=UPI00313B24E6